MNKAMTLEDMEADAKAAEEAAKAELTAPVTEQAPVVETKVEAPAPTPSPELDLIKKELADKQTRIDDLTKRIRDEDGRKGGEMHSLKIQIESLGNQLRELSDENRALRAKMDQPKPAPELPDPLEAEYPRVAEAINARTKPLREAVVRAEEVGKATRQQLTEMREARFFDAVTAAVPELEQYNADPEFVAWCVEIPVGEDERRQDKLNRYRSTANSKAAIGLLTKWAETKKTKSPVVVAEEPAPKKDKPTKEAQVQVPSSAAPSNTAQKSVQNDKARLAELETKVFRLGVQATKEDTQELERLYVEAEKRGELT